MNTKQLLNEWRRFLKETVNIENSVELNGTKLSVYHLTGHKKIVNNSLETTSQESPTEIKFDDNDRASRILYNLKKSSNAQYRTDQKTQDAIEFNAVRDILGDPYTKGTGFNPGSGEMYGRALYACYKFNPDIAKVYGDICLKFEVDISNYLIFFEDLAKQIHGEDWKIEDQIKKVLKAKGYDFNAVINNDDISQSALRKLINKILYLNQNATKKIANKSYLNDEDITSDPALRLVKSAEKRNMNTLFEGIIFRGRRDGPVCVIYNPVNKAKLVKIGRIVIDNEDTFVEWSDSLREFFGDIAKYTPDVDFQTMNDISDETHSNDSPEGIDFTYDEILYDLEVCEKYIVKFSNDDIDYYAKDNLKSAILKGFGILDQGPEYHLETTSAKNFINTFIKESGYHVYIDDDVIRRVFIKILSLDKYKNDISFCKNLAEKIVEPELKYDAWSYTRVPDNNQIQLELAQHSSYVVKSALLNNINISQKVVEFLTDDKDEEIAREAKSKIRR